MSTPCHHIVSFDIGIRNLAYCRFQVPCTKPCTKSTAAVAAAATSANDLSSITIPDWNVVDLTTPPAPTCTPSPVPNLTTTEETTPTSPTLTRAPDVCCIAQYKNRVAGMGPSRGGGKKRKASDGGDSGAEKACTKMSQYRLGHEYGFCTTHATWIVRNQAGWTSATQPTLYLQDARDPYTQARQCRGQKLSTLLDFATHWQLLPSGPEAAAVSAELRLPVLRKAEVEERLHRFFEERMLQLIVRTKTRTAALKTTKASAKKMSMVDIGRALIREMDRCFPPDIMASITHVVVENQIGPIAARMNTLQGMLCQYFLMRGSPSLNIDVVSSSGKLSGTLVADAARECATQVPDETPTTSPDPEPEPDAEEGGRVEMAATATSTAAEVYRRHKVDSVRITRHLLCKNANLTHGGAWLRRLDDLKKKDDFCDAFLQGLYFVRESL